MSPHADVDDAWDAELELWDVELEVQAAELELYLGCGA